MSFPSKCPALLRQQMANDIAIFLRIECFTSAGADGWPLLTPAAPLVHKCGYRKELSHTICPAFFCRCCPHHPHHRLLQNSPIRLLHKFLYASIKLLFIFKQNTGKTSRQSAAELSHCTSDGNQQQQIDDNSSSCSSEQLELVDEVTEEEETMLENGEGSDGEANLNSQNNSELTEVDAASEASEESVLYHNERVENVVESRTMESQTKRPRRIQEYNRKDRPKPSDPRQKRKSTETGRNSKENEQTALPDNNWRMALATAVLDLPQFAIERPHGTEDSGKKDEQEREEAGEQAPEKNNQKMPDEAGQQQQQQHQQQQQGRGESQNGADHHNMSHFPRGFPSSYHKWSDPRIRLPFPQNFPPSPAPRPLSFFNPPSNLRVVQNQGVGASIDLDLRSAHQTPQQEQQSPLFCHPLISVPSPSYSLANHYAEEEQRKKQQQIIMEENALLKKQLGKKTDECNSLQGSVKVLTERLESTNAVQREISKLKNQNCQLTKKSEKALEWEQKWKEKEGTTTKLKKKNEELEKSNSEIKKKNGELERSNSELNKKNERNTRSLSDLRELKRKLEEEQHSKTLELSTMQRKKGEELLEQKKKLSEEHRKIIDELKTEHQKNKEEFFVQKEEEQHRKIVELELNLRREYEAELGKREKQLSDNYQGEIDKLNTKIRMQTKEELAQQRSSPDDQQICESKHCEQIFKRNTEMIGIYKYAMRKCAKERNCGICKPLGSNDEQNAESGVPSSTSVIPLENTIPELIDSLHDVGQRSMEGMHRTDSSENREENSGESQTVEPTNEVQTGEECPPLLERSDSVANSLPSITCNFSLFDSFEEIKSQIKEQILQNTGLQSDSPQVEILLQEKMANYNKELKRRHVFMEEPAQQQQQTHPIAENCPSQSDRTLLPQLTPQITGTTVVTSVLSDANNYRQRNPKSARELQELSQLLKAGNAQRPQQLFHEPIVVHQSVQNPNSSSTAETVLRQTKRKTERNVLEEQSTMGMEPKYSRHHANCQPQNFHQQQNMQSALVGFSQPVSGQQFQPQMTQQHMFSVGPPNQQHMQQHAAVAERKPGVGFCSAVSTQQFHQQQRPIIRPMMFEPIHQAHILLQQQQPNSQQGAAQFSSADISPASASTTAEPVAKTIRHGRPRIPQFQK
uniref:Uncharacterized protein n=1 Tax=Globodera rostochiensis TaxID=31243 RepID=A0A914HGH6_GLORO